jgi:DNA-directed RNA polymerases I, II, and III subunit RPABC1
MCHDRGYLVAQHELDQTLEEFVETFGDKPSERRPARTDLLILVQHANDPTGKIHQIIP